jgi:hypothetical protein
VSGGEGLVVVVPSRSSLGDATPESSQDRSMAGFVMPERRCTSPRLPSGHPIHRLISRTSRPSKLRERAGGTALPIMVAKALR